MRFVGRLPISAFWLRHFIEFAERHLNSLVRGVAYYDQHRAHLRRNHLPPGQPCDRPQTTRPSGSLARGGSAECSACTSAAQRDEGFTAPHLPDARRRHLSRWITPLSTAARRPTPRADVCGERSPNLSVRPGNRVSHSQRSCVIEPVAEVPDCWDSTPYRPQQTDRIDFGVRHVCATDADSGCYATASKCGTDVSRRTQQIIRCDGPQAAPV
jgi:hypothetical protein